jgi:hypothetical protein
MVVAASFLGFPFRIHSISILGPAFHASFSHRHASRDDQGRREVMLLDLRTSTAIRS